MSHNSQIMAKDRIMSIFDGIKIDVVKPVTRDGEAKKNINPFRLIHGDFVIQPTKGYTVKGKTKTYSDDATQYNWAYCWFGIRNEGKHIAGFSMDNAKFMELVTIGTLPQGMGEAFKVFCEANEGLVQVKVG